MPDKKPGNLIKKFRIKYIPSLLFQTYNEMLDDKAFKMAAALSYYAVFSLGPLLIIVIAIAGFIFGEDAAKGQIFSELKNLTGPDGAIVIEAIVKGAADKSTGIIAAIFSMILLVVGSIGVFVELQESLNIIWGVEPRPGRGIWGFIKTRLISFSMVAVTGFLLMVSLVLNSVIMIVNMYMSEQFPAVSPLLFILNSAASLFVITLLFAMIYKFLPDAYISWKYVWLGAIITSVLFTAGKYLIGLYLGNSTFSSTYGAAASIIVLFVWIYYSGLILFFGAELTQVYRKKYTEIKLTADSDGIVVPKVSDLLKAAVKNNLKRKNVNKAAILKEKKTEQKIRESNTKENI